MADPAFIQSVSGAPRLLFEAALEPLQGHRFQPTGFPDLGAAIYQRPDGTRMCLVESAQSVANRLERAVVDGTGPDIVRELDGLPYVRVRLDGDGGGIVTSSLVEAHRLNSPFIIAPSAGFAQEFTERAGYSIGQPIDWKKAAAAVFYYDPSCLLHGVFFANIPDGRLRFPRALTGFVEAEGVETAASGGVKNNAFDPSGQLRASDLAADVYGNVPYPRLEYTARSIKAYFNLDLDLLRTSGLPEQAQRLLTGLSLYKVRRFLGEGLRLRTACDLRVLGDLRVTQPDAVSIPAGPALLAGVRAALAECRATPGLLHDGVRDLIVKTKRAKKTKEEAQEQQED